MSNHKNHYYFDEDRCEFVPVIYNTKNKLINSFSFWLINGTVMAIIALSFLTNFVGTPAEIALKDENRILLDQLTQTASSIDNLEVELQKIAQHDNEMYRTILGIEPISQDIRTAGIGGSDSYSQFDYYNQETSQLLKSTASRIDQLERRIGIQKLSFDEIKASYNDNQVRLRNMPAIKPVNGIMVSGYGMRPHPILRYNRMHEGVDFRADVNTEVFATGDGTVIHAGRRGAFGNLLEIDHGFGIITRYAHLSRFESDIKVGTKVTRGDIVAYSGNTGRSAGPHLHYEVLLEDVPQDPISYMIADISPEEYLLFRGIEAANNPISYTD
ncbi:MAG: M23 family metallopeptidase [Balneolaceae bacterium]